MELSFHNPLGVDDSPTLIKDNLLLVKQVTNFTERKLANEIHNHIAANFELIEKIKETTSKLTTTNGDKEYLSPKLIECLSETKILIDLYFKLINNKYESKVPVKDGVYVINNDVLHDVRASCSSTLMEILSAYSKNRSLVNKSKGFEKASISGNHLTEYPDNGVDLSTYIDLGILTE